MSTPGEKTGVRQSRDCSDSLSVPTVQLPSLSKKYPSNIIEDSVTRQVGTVTQVSVFFDVLCYSEL